MKESPQQHNLEDILRSSQIVAGGFMGDDERPVTEIIDTDARDVERHGYTNEQIADRMEQVRDEGQKGLGSPMKIDHLLVTVDDNRGMLPSPWPDDTHRSTKTTTFVKDLRSQKELVYSDLSIHLIRAHGFYQGRGSAFRLEPRDIISVLCE